MDCPWLHEEADVAVGSDSEEEKSDSEEVEHELESRLYSIVHHNDLSQPLPLELAKHYSLHHSDDGDITVTLNLSLEQLKSEESKQINEILDPPVPTNEEVLEDGEIAQASDDDVIIVSEVIKPRHFKKRVRYSDVNIDELNSRTDGNLIETSVSTKDISNVNNLKSLLSKNDRGFSQLNIPSFFDFSDWESNSNSSFIPIGSNGIMNDPSFKVKMRKTLEQINPGVKKKKLWRLAEILFQRNMNLVKNAERRELRNVMRRNLINGKDIMSNLPVEIQDNFFVNQGGKGNVLNCQQDFSKSQHEINRNETISLNIEPSKHVPPTINLINNEQYGSKSKNKKRIDGSVSLNSSPFRPNPQIQDINSEDQRNASINKMEIPNSSKTNSQSFIPTKWSKEMIAFYVIPSKKKMKMDLNSIFHQFNRTTKASDWKLDPRDETGVYQRPGKNMKKPQRRCKNCKQRDHTAQNCPQPKKILACFLCGENYHSGYSCYKSVCLKCGIYSPEGECVECYYHNFQFDTLCERCGSALHRTSYCPDSWRSFHSTIEGEMKIPETQMENRRRFCCNCARWGHFSHKCPTSLHTGQQTSPFVTNYSTALVQEGTTEIFLSNKFQEIINCPEADEFLQDLSNKSKAQIQMEQDDRGVLLKISGTFEQCINVKSGVEAYVNTKKRKREEPHVRRKRRRLK